MGYNQTGHSKQASLLPPCPANERRFALHLTRAVSWIWRLLVSWPKSMSLESQSCLLSAVQWHRQGREAILFSLVPLWLTSSGNSQALNWPSPISTPSVNGWSECMKPLVLQIQNYRTSITQGNNGIPESSSREVPVLTEWQKPEVSYTCQQKLWTKDMVWDTL